MNSIEMIESVEVCMVICRFYIVSHRRLEHPTGFGDIL